MFIKGMLIVLGSICLLLLCIAWVGSRLPERHVTSMSALYPEQPDRLFSLISGSQLWRSDVKHEEIVVDASGRQLSRETNRRGRSITYDVSVSNPPYRVIRRIHEKGLAYSGSWTYSIEPNAGGTKVTITEEGDVYNPALRFVSRFLVGYTRTMETYLVELGRATGSRVTAKREPGT